MPGIGVGATARGGTKAHPRDWRRSAEPEDEVDARFPCYTRGWVKNEQAEWGSSSLYLDHTNAGACCDDGGGGADVESVVCIPASADDIDDKILVRVEYDGGNGA
jgi:hypothetical protein